MPIEVLRRIIAMFHGQSQYQEEQQQQQQREAQHLASALEQLKLGVGIKEAQVTEDSPAIHFGGSSAPVEVTPLAALEGTLENVPKADPMPKGRSKRHL